MLSTTLLIHACNTVLLQTSRNICFHLHLYQQTNAPEPSSCFSCLLQEALHSVSLKWNISFVVIVRDRLIFCGHMPYVLKEDDKYCFVTCSWQNAKRSENKDTFHTWSFKKILGKLLQTELQFATCEFDWLRRKFIVIFYSFVIDSSLHRALATTGLCHIIINLSSAHCLNENLLYIYIW